MSYIAYPLAQTLQVKEMYSLFTEHYAYGYHYPGESHNFWEGVYLLSGSMCASGDQNVYNASADDIVFYAPLEFHKFTIDHPKGASLFIFSFSADGMPLEFLKHKVFHLTASQKEIITGWMRYISEKNKSRTISGSGTDRLEKTRFSPNYGQMLSLYLCQLLLSLGNDGHIVAASETPEAAVFTKAVGYMKQHIDHMPSVTAIAAYCSISETGLKRIFTKYAGIGIHKYFLHLKFKTAVTLLQDGLTVTETAEKLGFSDQGYFSKAFKREIGVSPGFFKHHEG